MTPTRGLDSGEQAPRIFSPQPFNVDDDDNAQDDEQVPEETGDTDQEDVPPSGADAQEVLALVNKVLRKGTKGKELEPKHFIAQAIGVVVTSFEQVMVQFLLARGVAEGEECCSHHQHGRKNQGVSVLA